MMEYYLQDEDDIIQYRPRFDEYVLSVHDNDERPAASGVTIHFCPWCGKKLPEPRRGEVLDREEESVKGVRANNGATCMIRVSVDDAKTQLSDLIDAAVRGETVLIETEKGEQGTHVVQLVAVPQQTRRKRKAGSAKDLIIYIADDFDAPLEDFREYME